MSTPKHAFEFDDVLRVMPHILFESFDPLQHKTVSDLLAMAQHEVDMHEEQQDGAFSDAEIQRVKKFIVRVKENQR